MSTQSIAFDRYIKLILNAQSRELPEGDIEHHHIVPQSLLKEDNEWLNENKNLTVPLTPAEHYTAHELLSEAFPEINCLQNGLKWFKHQAKSVHGNTSPLLYESARQVIRQKISKALSGRTKYTHDYLKIRGINHTAERHHNYDETVYILEKMDSGETFIGTQYNLREKLELNRSHLCRHLRYQLYGIHESGGQKRKSVGGYRAIGVINTLKDIDLNKTEIIKS